MTRRTPTPSAAPPSPPRRAPPRAPGPRRRAARGPGTNTAIASPSASQPATTAGTPCTGTQAVGQGVLVEDVDDDRQRDQRDHDLGQRRPALAAQVQVDDRAGVADEVADEHQQHAHRAGIEERVDGVGAVDPVGEQGDERDAEDHHERPGGRARAAEARPSRCRRTRRARARRGSARPRWRRPAWRRTRSSSRRS